MAKTFTGFDLNTYRVGDRVEIHPATDLFMRGARYATVVGGRTSSKDRVHVEFDRMPGRTMSGSEDTFKWVADGEG